MSTEGSRIGRFLTDTLDLEWIAPFVFFTLFLFAFRPPWWLAFSVVPHAQVWIWFLWPHQPKGGRVRYLIANQLLFVVLMGIVVGFLAAFGGFPLERFLEMCIRKSRA